MPEKEQLVSYWRKSGLIKNEAVLNAFMEVPREKFVLDSYLEQAYGDYPLPISAGQTISQPTTVMIMTQALELGEGQKVLEIGTGSGYQAAIIAKIIGDKGKVITTEIISELVDFSRKNLASAGIKNVKVISSDGSIGYENEAPYDRCIITAACPKVPQPIIEQLKNNGIIIAPVGSAWSQSMMKIRKRHGKLETENLGEFVFVPLKGKYGN